MHEIDDILSTPSTDLQKTLRCSREVCQTIYLFAKKEKCSGLMARFQPTFNSQGVMISFQVSVAARVASTGDVTKYRDFFQGNRLFHLVVYDIRTSALLCYRKFNSKLDDITFNVNVTPQAQNDDNCKGNNMRVSVNLICDEMVGQDFCAEFPPSGETIEDEEGPFCPQSASHERENVKKSRQSLLSFQSSPKKSKTSLDEGDVDCLSNQSVSSEETRQISVKRAKRRKSSKAESDKRGDTIRAILCSHIFPNVDASLLF